MPQRILTQNHNELADRLFHMARVIYDETGAPRTATDDQKAAYYDLRTAEKPKSQETSLSS